MSSTPPRGTTPLPGGGQQRLTSPLSPTSSRFTTGTASLNIPWQTTATSSAEAMVANAAIEDAMTQNGALGFSASTSPQPTPDVNVITSGGSSALVSNAELPQTQVPRSASNYNKESGKKSSSKTNEEEKVDPLLPMPGEEPVILGVCAMDVKARSKAMREILTRLVEIEKGGVNVKLFGDMVILEEGTFRSLLFYYELNVELMDGWLAGRHYTLASRRCSHFILLQGFPIGESDSLHSITQHYPPTTHLDQLARHASALMGPSVGTGDSGPYWCPDAYAC